MKRRSGLRHAAAGQDVVLPLQEIRCPAQTPASATAKRSITRLNHRSHWRRAGASAVELAISLPVLLMLSLGGVDIGRAYTTRSAVTNAARVGAEQGATHRLTNLTMSTWEDRIQDAILEELQDTPQLDLSRINIDIDPVREADGRLRVVVSVTAAFQTIVRWPGFPRPLSIEHTVSVEEHR